MFKKIILICIFLTGLAVRIYKINAPLADWHSFRQADTASVSRELITQGFDLLRPKYHDLSNIQSGFKNPEGYRMVEFPIYNALHALTYQLANNLISFEAAGRLVSIIASLGAAYFLFFIVKNEINWLTGAYAAAFFLFLPFNIFYSRTILPDSLMIFFSLGSIYFLKNFQNAIFNFQNILGLVFGALALLTKPYAVFLIFPSLLYFFIIKIKSFDLKKISLFTVYCLLITVPLIGWRWWIQQFPQGIPDNRWLLNSNQIRLRPAWWRWLFYERLSNLILGGWGLILFGLGLITQIKNKTNWLFYFLAGGIFFYLVVFATGNVQHDYYQIIALPVVAIFLAKGAYFLTKPPENLPLIPSYLLLITSVLFGLIFSWFQVKEYYNINHPEIIAAGQKANKILPQDAKVIAPYQGDTAFLYQTSRRGWPAVTQSIEELVDMGADYLVGVNFDQTVNRLKEECTVIEESDQWIIIDLNDCEQEE